MLLLLRKILLSRFWAQGNRAWYGAFYASTAVHLAAMTLFACMWVLPDQQKEIAPFMSSRWESQEEPDRLEELVETITLFPKEASSSAGGQPKKASSLIKFDQTFRVSHLHIKPVALLVDHSTYEIPQASLSEEVGEVPQMGEAKQNGNGEGKGVENGKGDGKGAHFFGMQVEGKNFVYVVDCSRSMNHPHPSEAKTRFKRLKMELLQSISQLSPDKEFFVIFFNSEPVPMPARQMQLATGYNKSRYLAWVAKLQADGKTDPRAAMQLAMRLKPDVIYFLTDGSFEPKVERGLKKISQKQTAIHTYAFSNSAGEKTLKQIARQNRGNYTYVP